MGPGVSEPGHRALTTRRPRSHFEAGRVGSTPLDRRASPANGSTVSGAGPRRVPRRRLAREAGRLEAEHRKQLLAARRAELELLRAEQRERPYLPAGGEKRDPMAGRSYRRLRLPPTGPLPKSWPGPTPSWPKRASARPGSWSARTSGRARRSAMTRGRCTAKAS